jgi:hypothetical protein
MRIKSTVLVAKLIENFADSITFFHFQYFVNKNLDKMIFCDVEASLNPGRRRGQDAFI